MINLFYYSKGIFSSAVITILILTLLSCSSDDDEKINNPNSKEYSKLTVDQEINEELKIPDNKVKERRTYSKFTTNIIKSGGNEVLAEKLNFDKDGKKTEQYRYSSTKVEVQWLIDYDEFGNQKLIEEYDGFQQLLKRTYFNYKSNGLLLNKQIDSKGNKVYYEYEYDDSLNLAIMNTFNNDKVLYSKTIYRYDNSKLDSIIFSRNNSIYQIIVLEYDSLDRRIGEKTIISDKIVENIIYSYDENGNLSKISISKVASIQYNYDNRGNVIEEIYYDAIGNMQSRITYEYDKNTYLLQNKVKYDGLNRASLDIRYEYDFY